MAHPSPSPSGSSRRRLSEVLDEQQEPFSLDLYLLEKGCSPSLLDATACGGGACSTCWPKTRGTGRTLRRPARNKKGSRRSSGVLRMLLSKILSGTTTPDAATKHRQQQQRAAIGWRRVVVAEKQRTPGSFELAHGSASPGAVVEAHMEDDVEQEDDEEEDESSKKQLSPVSVLEPRRLFEHSSPPPHAPKALAIFSVLLEAAYTPNTLLDDDVLATAAKDRSRSTQSKDGRSTDDSSTPPTTTPRARRRRKKKKHARHQKEDVAFEKDLGRLTTSLVASEMAGASVRAEDLRPSVEDVGVLIAAAVLEALTEEAAAELMGMDSMDHGCAVGVARWCGRC